MPNKPLDGVIEPGMLENSDTGIGMAHTASVEERELALIDSLLDRYGVIAAPWLTRNGLPEDFQRSIRYSNEWKNMAHWSEACS